MSVKSIITCMKVFKSTSVTFFWLFTFISFSNANASVTESNPKIDTVIWSQEPEQIRAKLKHLQKLAWIEGMSVGVLSKDAEPMTFALGIANAESSLKIDDTTIFQAASLSKPLLSFIVLKMVQRDEISLDQPLHEILENARIQNKEWATLITPRYVLSHQTGLPNWGGDTLKFNFEPGTAFNYSGEGYVYLQKVLEKITGLTYQEIAVKEVFEPLKMTNSYFTWDDGDKLKLASGHNRAGQPIGLRIPDSNAAASLHTTASDYLKFIRAWLDASQITVGARNEVFKSAGDTTKYKPELINISWGLGWGLYQFNQSQIAWHWGDNGQFRAFVAFEPATERAFVYFTNSENGLAISKQMMELFFPGTNEINEWLGYGQADSDIWQAERLGYVESAAGNYAAAIEQFEVVLREYPDNSRIKGKIDWIKPIAEKRSFALNLTPEVMQKIVGSYGDRKLFLSDGTLSYQRGSGAVHALTPLYDSVFQVGDLPDFRLEVSFNSDGIAEKLIGRYEGGWSDESVRASD